MGGNSNRVTIYIDGDSKGVERASKQTVSALGQIGSLVAEGFGLGAGIAAFGGITAAVGALGSVVRDSFAEFAAAEKVQSQVNAVLQSTGGIAGVTAEAVNEYATSLAGVTRYEDDAIKGAESMLLTFTSIGADVFPQATEAVLNMTEKFGSMESASVQVGKALQDPITGVTALRRVGVMLTDAQEQQIKALRAVNDVAGAQRIILKELETEFGGLARAGGATLGGTFDRMNNAIGNLKESIGGLMAEPATKTINFVTSGVDAVQAQIDGLKAQSPVIVEVRTVAQAEADVARTSPRVSPMIEEMWSRRTDIASDSIIGVQMYGEAWNKMTADQIANLLYIQGEEKKGFDARIAMLDEYNNRAGADMQKQINDAAVLADTQTRWAGVVKDFQQSESASYATSKKLANGLVITTDALVDYTVMTKNAAATDVLHSKVMAERSVALSAQNIAYDRAIVAMNDYAYEAASKIVGMNNYIAALQGIAVATQTIADMNVAAMRTLFPENFESKSPFGSANSADNLAKAYISANKDVADDFYGKMKGAIDRFMPDFDPTQPKNKPEGDRGIKNPEKLNPADFAAFKANPFQPGDQWDEMAHRAEDVIAKGTGSNWDKLFDIPPEAGAKGEEGVKAWAATYVDDFYNGLKLGDVNWAGPIADMTNGLQAEATKSKFAAEFMAKAFADPAAKAALNTAGVNSLADYSAGLMGGTKNAAGQTVVASPLADLVSQSNSGGALTSAATAQAGITRTAFANGLLGEMTKSGQRALENPIVTMVNQANAGGALVASATRAAGEIYGAVQAYMKDHPIKVYYQFGGGSDGGPTTPTTTSTTPKDWWSGHDAAGANGVYGVVPSGYPNDSFRIAASTGESFSVLTPGQRRSLFRGGGMAGGGGDVYEVHIHTEAFMGREADAQAFADMLVPYLRRASRSQYFTEDR